MKWYKEAIIYTLITIVIAVPICWAVDYFATLYPLWGMVASLIGLLLIAFGYIYGFVKERKMKKLRK